MIIIGDVDMKKRRIILLIILSFVMLGCSKEDIQKVTKKDNNIIKYEDVTLNKDGIDFKGIVLVNGKVLIYAKNTNDKDKEIRYVINFLNKDKEKVSTSKTILYNIAASKESYVLISDIPKEFSTYEIEPTIYDTNLSSIEVTSTKEDGNKGVKVTINNKNNNKVGVDIGVLYYDKDNNIVGYEYDAGEIETTKSKEFTILHPYDRDFDVLEYDHYKEVINQSYVLK